jgi:hypothetical protein
MECTTAEAPLFERVGNACSLWVTAGLDDGVTVIARWVGERYVGGDCSIKAWYSAIIGK